MKSYTDDGHSIHISEFMQWLNSKYKDNLEDSIGVLDMSTHWFIILTKEEHNA